MEAMFSTLLDLPTTTGLYVNMRKTKGTKYHVYLEPSAKRVFVRRGFTYINMQMWQN